MTQAKEVSTAVPALNGDRHSEVSDAKDFNNSNGLNPTPRPWGVIHRARRRSRL
jgi:hypothetical protein